MHRIKHWTRKFHDEYFKLFYGKPNKCIPRVLNGPITWPFYQRGLEREKLQHFISNSVNIYKQSVNSKNTLFVVGPQGSGKSWFLKNICKNSIVIDNAHYNFDSFFDLMKSEIIKYVCYQKLITADEIIKIATNKYLPQYLDIYINQYIRDRLTDKQRDELKSCQDTIKLDNLDWQTGELEFWQEDAIEIKQNQSNPFSFQSSFQNLVKMLDKNIVQESIQLMLDIIQQIEIDKIDNPIKITSTIAAKQQMDFLFDILNYLSGFAKESDKYHEISVVLMNIDKITEYYRYDMEVYDFFDHLILKTYNMSGIRNHFPLVIESSDSKFFNRDMMEMMNVELNTVLHLDILDISKEQIQSQIEGIFTQEEIDLIYDKIGGSLQVWHQLTKEAVTNNEFNLENWFMKYSQIEEAKFINKMNSLITNNEISDLLDNHHIDAEIFRVMKAFHEFKGIMYTGTYYADMLLMENSVVHALQQERIIHHPKYISHLFFTKKVYDQYCKTYLERKKKSIKFWPQPEKDADLLVSAFKLKKKERGEYLVQISEEPRKYIYDDLRKEERPYHEYYI